MVLLEGCGQSRAQDLVGGSGHWWQGLEGHILSLASLALSFSCSLLSVYYSEKLCMNQNPSFLLISCLSSVLIFFRFFLVVLGLELRALFFLGRPSTTSVTPPVLFPSI
jgi:hypothetical protein